MIEKLGIHAGRPQSQNGSGQYAIVGMAARMPGARDLPEFWDNLVNGRESIKFFTKEELDSTLDPSETNAPNYVAARGIIEDADHFDARFFKTPPRTAEMTCPQQRILLELAWTALEDAGLVPGKTADTVGVWAGTYTTSYFIKNILTNPALVQQTGEFQAGVLNEKDYIATRVAHALNLTGPAINVNTACYLAGRVNRSLQVTGTRPLRRRDCRWCFGHVPAEQRPPASDGKHLHARWSLQTV